MPETKSSETIKATPANASMLFQKLGSIRAVSDAMGITRPHASALLNLAGANLKRKTFEELHPRPDNAQEIYEQCGSSRGFGEKYGYSQRQSCKILSHWGIVLKSGRDEESVRKRDEKAGRVWCEEMKRACVFYGMQNCGYCKWSKNMPGT
jgi:hypothetical protein